MMLSLAAVLAVLVLLLTLVTLVQTLYMDSVRLRSRDLEFLDLFREVIGDRIGMKTDDGILTFSLVKHTILVLLGILFLLITTDGDAGLEDLAEAVGLSWTVMMIAAYIVPQLLYRRTTGAWFLPLVPLVKLLALLVKPVTAVLGFLQSLAQLGDAERDDDDSNGNEDSIDALITAGAEEGILEEDDRKLIQSVVAFGDKTVREVMTPRPSIVGIEADATLEDLRKLVINEQYSRIPVYRETIDHVLGFVHVRDMFELDENERAQMHIHELLRPIRLVPETKAVNDLLREMQIQGAHMAIVVDEYGSTAGLVTMEDMVEEIVGEIRDEHEPASDVERDGNGGYIVSGSFDVDHLEELLGFRPAEETESTTVGGLLTEWMGRVPQPGETIERAGIRMEAIEANELRVDRVRVSHAESDGNGNNGKE